MVKYVFFFPALILALVTLVICFIVLYRHFDRKFPSFMGPNDAKAILKLLAILIVLVVALPVLMLMGKHLPSGLSATTIIAVVGSIVAHRKDVRKQAHEEKKHQELLAQQQREHEDNVRLRMREIELKYAKKDNHTSE